MEEDTDTLDLSLQLLLAACHPQHNDGQNNCRILIHPLVPAAQGQKNILACRFIKCLFQAGFLYELIRKKYVWKYFFKVSIKLAQLYYFIMRRETDMKEDLNG